MVVTDVVRSFDADVVGLQEALHFQLEEMKAALPEYGSAGVGRDDGAEAGEYAAILYRSDRLELMEDGTFWFSDTPAVPGSMSWGNELPRICTWARFRDRRTGMSLALFNVHWDHQSQPSRERAAGLLLERVQETAAGGSPVLVT
jgi:endonuclease/exonuclease/phosphatase family metal-dependent hydrolase